MKILVISNMYPSVKVPNYGTFVKNFCDQLDEIDVEYIKVVMNKDLNKLISYFLYYFKIFFNVMFKKYDYVYVHYASHNAIPITMLRKIKKFKVYTNVHGGDVVPQTSTQFKMQKYTKKLLSISEKVVVPSVYFKELMMDKYKIEEQKINIYPSGGINEELFLPYSQEKKNEIKIDKIDLDSNMDYIGYIGRLEKGKGWDTFLKAICELKNRNFLNNKRAIIIGNGKEINMFKEMLNQLDLHEYVIHVESMPQSKLPQIYNILSVFCFPTEREGESLGLVALESLACGTPVIASDFAAPKDYIINGYNGYKFEKNNSVELANSIEKYFMLDENERQNLKKNAYDTGKKYYSKNLKNDLEYVIKK